MLAHKIHDEEISEARKLDEAIILVGELSPAGVRHVLEGNASTQATAAFKLVAKKIGT